VARKSSPDPPFDRSCPDSVALALPYFPKELHHEAHVSAQYPSPGEDPRVSGTHAHACGTLNSGCAPYQGPHSSFCLTVLAADSRLRSSAEFAQVIRGGTRASAPTLVVHLLVPSEPDDSKRCGFTVSKAVGNSVLRHRVTRRLRAVMATRLHNVPAGSRIVIRALPGAAGATSSQLAQDLDAALASVMRKMR
jgi:ribonuclease P protein component